MKYQGRGSKGDFEVVSLTNSMAMGHCEGKYHREELLVGCVWGGEDDEFFGAHVDLKEPGGDSSGSFMKAIENVYLGSHGKIRTRSFEMGDIYS